MKYYSRRELYALGETLGESVTQAKVGGGRIYGGGGSGGGGGGPQQTTVQNTNIPEYARPYVETMLGTAQQQIYNYDPSGTVSGFKPYIPYGATVDASGNITNTAQQQAQAAVAPFSPMQESAFQQTAQLGVPGQFALGTGYQALGGLGSLGAGRDYVGAATSPYAQQAFMSPYMQNVVNVQKNEALRDAQMRNIGANLGAARQGTYGGARQLLAEQERNRNLQTQLAQIQATGSQEAFKSGQQAQQFAADLGLRGFGQATQAGTALGQMGTQQLAAQQGIIGLQSQAGAQQQALEQQKINQAMQNYAMQQQYPFQQLALMSALTRGLPLQTATTQSYQAAPSAISQIGGLGAAGLGLYGMGKTAGMFKEGGVVKMAGGGIAGLSRKVLMNPEDYSTQQIDRMTKKGMITPLVGIPVLDAKTKEAQRMKMMQAAQQPRPIDTIAADVMARAEAAPGIDNAPSNLPIMSAFDGGIVAMADGGEIEENPGIVELQGGGFMDFLIPKYDKPEDMSEEEFAKVSRPVQAQATPIKPLSPRRPVAEPAPVAPAPKKDTGIKILPDAPRPTAGAAPAPAAPAMSDMDLSGKGIADILKRFEEAQSKSAEKDTEDKKMAFWSSLAQLGFGAMGGTSPYAATNIGQAGAPAVSAGMQQLRDIRGREEKRGIAGLQAALEGEKIKADYTKLGMLQPYYKSMAEYYQRRPAGGSSTAGLGSVTPAVADKVMTRFQGYEADPKSAPFFGQLPKDVQQGLTKYKPGTESYRRSMEIFRQYNDKAMQNYLNSLRGYAAKSAVSASED